MDNLRTHHVQAAGELLRDTGAEALSPPVYSPDLNPIEKLWSREFPEIMRKKEARAGSAGQGGGRRRADARQGRQRGPAIPGPLNVSHDFWVLL